MVMKKGIDVFTPTYNRAYCLENVYNSIINQSYKDVTWVLIDDGSSDNTQDLVKRFISEGKIEIRYYFQENKGRFAAFNTAKQFFQRELIVFVDSDDYLLQGGLEKIYRCWDKIGTRQKEYSGIIAYFETQDGKMIGTEFPNDIEAERIYRLYDRYSIKGDKFLAFRNDLIQKYSYPVYVGEKFCGDELVFNWINDECPMWILREKIAHRDYLSDGLTNNRLRHHLLSPNGMADHYNGLIRVEKNNKKNIIKHCIGYIAYCVVAGRSFIKTIKQSNRKLLTVILVFPGAIYGFRLRKLKRKI